MNDAEQLLKVDVAGRVWTPRARRDARRGVRPAGGHQVSNVCLVGAAAAAGEGRRGSGAGGRAGAVDGGAGGGRGGLPPKVEPLAMRDLVGVRVVGWW